MNFLKYIRRMLILSLILTIAANLLLLTVRFFPFEVFAEWVWQFDFGGAVVIIPWFAMIALSLLFTVIQMFFRRKD